MKRVFISVYPFGQNRKKAVDLLRENGFSVSLNPYKKRITPGQLKGFIKNADYLIAGTERIDGEVLKSAKKLKLIVRLGAGTDSVDIRCCAGRKIKLSRTPDEPRHAVAELIIGMILCIYRDICGSNSLLKKGKWERPAGNLLRGKTVGLIGLGRVGKRLAELLSGFGVKMLAFDRDPDISFAKRYRITLAGKERLLRDSDVVSLSIPYSKENIGFIRERDFKTMKKSAVFINTARGGIVDEDDLFSALKKKDIAAAGVDVFGKEPYKGGLAALDNCIITPHIGTCALETRDAMEYQAAAEIIGFEKRRKLKSEVSVYG
jgi:D-3-phosphoglycerate dehydrogenase